MVYSGQADELNKPIDARKVWMKIAQSNGIAECPVNRQELNQDLSTLQNQINIVAASVDGKITSAQVLALLQAGFRAFYQEYPLTNGYVYTELDATDNKTYTYTAYVVQTTFVGSFEKLSIVVNDGSDKQITGEYAVYKQTTSRIIIVFRSLTARWVDNYAKIKLIGIPSQYAPTATPVPTPAPFPTPTPTPTPTTPLYVFDYAALNSNKWVSSGSQIVFDTANLQVRNNGIYSGIQPTALGAQINLTAGTYRLTCNCRVSATNTSHEIYAGSVSKKVTSLTFDDLTLDFTLANAVTNYTGLGERDSAGSNITCFMKSFSITKL